MGLFGTDFSLGDVGAAVQGIGSLFGASSQDKANRRNEEANRAFQQQLLNRQDVGTEDPFGTTVSRTGGGPLKTSLVGGTREAADLGLENVLGQERAKLPGVEAGGQLIKDVATRLPPPRAPLTLDQARGVVGRDDAAIADAIIKPASQNAAMLDARMRRGMSSAGNIVNRFNERILPQIKLGGEQRAMDLESKERQRLGSELTTAQALMMDPRFAPTIPGTTGVGEIAQAGAMIPKPVDTSPSYTGTAGLYGIGNTLRDIQSRQDMVAANQKNEAFRMALLNRLNLDQGGGGQADILGGTS